MLLQRHPAFAALALRVERLLNYCLRPSSVDFRL
jgi:hypothetical protein